MTRRYRAFAEAFVRHMKSRGWPKSEIVRVWFSANTRGLKTEKYTQLKRGEALDERYAEDLVRFFVERAALPSPPEYAQAFVDYLQAHGVADAVQADFEDVVACVCERPSSRPAACSVGADLLLRGVDAIADVLNTKRRLIDMLRPCASADEVQDAVRWSFVVQGRTRISPAAGQNAAAAIAAAEQFLGVSLGRYQQAAISWWEFSPWAVCLALGRKRPVGATVVLPITPDAYGAITAGRQLSCETTPDQLEIPAATLLIELLAERPDDLGAEAVGMVNATKALFAALMTQCGVFIRELPRLRSSSVRALSFGGTPTNRKRLIGFGFKPLGKRMPGTGLPFMEKQLSLGALSRDVPLMWFMRYAADVFAESGDG